MLKNINEILKNENNEEKKEILIILYSGSNFI
jgi:hypothetical protein